MNTRRIRVSPSGRYLEREDGPALLYLGDTAWGLFHRLTRDEAERYLTDRARKGFTVVQAVVLAELDGLSVANANGDLPLAYPRAGAALYLNHDGCFLGWFEPTFGMRIRSRRRTPSVVELELEGERIAIGCEYRLIMEEAGADVLGREESGNPVFTRHTVGDGAVYLLAAPLERHLSSTPGAFTAGPSAAAWRIYASMSAGVRGGVSGGVRGAALPGVRGGVSDVALPGVRGGRTCFCDDPMVTCTEHEVDEGNRIVVAVNNAPEARTCSFVIADGWRVSSVPVGGEDGQAEIDGALRVGGNDAVVMRLWRTTD